MGGDVIKVAFIIPRSGQSGAGEYKNPGKPHTGIGYLAAVLAKFDIDVKILDMGLGYSIDAMQKTLDEYKPDLVGVTSFSFGYMKAYQLIEIIKLKKEYPVVVGGPHVSAFRSRILAETEADFAVKEEGEHTLPELCKALEVGKAEYKEIKGLIWRGADGIVENEDRSYITDLDSLPYPDYERFELEKYLCYKDRSLAIITSRGCPYQCNFCSIKICMGNKFRPRSSENVVDEIEYWYNKGWKKFDFNDDNFTFDLRRAGEICDKIVERGLKIQYTMYNGIRVDRVNKEILQKMRASGCIHVAYGIESGNQEILKKIKKGITLNQAVDAINIANEVGINNAATFIIGHPYETYEKAMESARFAQSLPTDYISFYNLVPYPGSELYEWVKTNGTFLYPEETYLNEVGVGEKKPIFETKEFPAREREKALKKCVPLYRKTVLKHKLGRIPGSVVYQLAKNDTLWKAGTAFFKGTAIGDRIFKYITNK